MDLIEHILTQSYPRQNGFPSTKQVAYPVSIYTSDFGITDSKSCNAAQKNSRHKCNACNKIVLNIDTTQPVKALRFDEYATQFDGTSAAIKGNRCDYLLYDDFQNPSRLVLCELTCSEAQYVEPNEGNYSEGKRARAYKQIKDSIENLLNIFILDVRILTTTSKIGLFGWREEKEVSDADKAIKSMLDFAATPSEQEPILYTDDFILGHNFIFVQIKYPSHFDWNKQFR